MTKIGPALLMLAATAVEPLSAAWSQDSRQGGILAYHGGADRTGNFVIPELTWDRAKSIHLDENFHGRIAGNVYAQPLLWQGRGSGAGLLLVASEDNNVLALDVTTGSPVWTRSLGRPVARSALRCGNINPLGITGTPVIDEASQAIYLAAAIEDASGPRHRVFALSLRDGAPLQGWPIDVADALRGDRQSFNARDQNQRGALTVLDGTLYVPYGGHFGDCGDYHGWVVGIALKDPKKISAWATRARGGGIWAPGGITVVGRSLFVATGNTFGASAWSDGEAVIRLTPSLDRSNDKRDFFAPSDWRTLDARDADLGGSNPAPLEINGPSGRQVFILALGKDGRAYLLDRDNLGGIGGSVATETVTSQPIRTAAATYTLGTDGFAALQAGGARCGAGKTARGGGDDLVVLKVTAGAQPSISTAWCGNVRGRGSPIVTTTDGHSDPIVWMVGAEGDNRLHAFRGDTGEPLLARAGAAMSGLHHFQTLIAAQDRIFVGADGRIYAFAF